MDVHDLDLLSAELDHMYECIVWHIVDRKMCITISPAIYQCRGNAQLDFQEEGCPNLCIPYCNYFEYEGVENSELGPDLIIPISQIVMIRFDMRAFGADASTPNDETYWARTADGTLRHFHFQATYQENVEMTP